MKYPFVFYVKNLPGKKHGKVNGPIIRILKTRKWDKPLLKHELVHVKQFFRTLGIHGILYNISKKYRYKCELEAYRKQLDCYQNDAVIHNREILFAGFIVENYKLHKTYAEVYDDLVWRPDK